MVFKQWQMPAADPDRTEGLAARVLKARGQTESSLFTEDSLADPFLMADMDKAVQRIRRAVEEGEQILVYGDFDCDGITATVMLYDFLEHCGANVLYYIPHREAEGYGLNMAALDRIKAAGVTLVITVDNGISAVAEANYAKQLGLDLIIADHHTPRETLPDALAVIDPHRDDCPYPYKDLCGAGVAFQLISALEGGERETLFDQYGDLLTIATLADVVPLTGENRAIVKKGLDVLAETLRPGLLALAEAAGLDLGRRDADLVTFGIAPRINATGRIGSVDTAVELLLCEDEDRAMELAKELNTLNEKRKEIEKDIISDIEQMIREDDSILRQRVLVFVGRDWNRGVVGITASRITERYGKPCVILSVAEGEARGSARSVEGFNIIGAIHACGHLLTKYGGHPMAAGLSLTEDNVAAFTKALLDFSGAQHPVMPRPVLQIDALLSAGEVTLENIRALEKLAPFGCENPQPVFGLPGQKVARLTPLSAGSHLRLGLEGGMEIVLFGVGPDAFPFSPGEGVDCAVTLSVNRYNGQERPSARLAAIRPAMGVDWERTRTLEDAYDAIKRGEAPLGVSAEDTVFTREDLSVVYRFLRGNPPFYHGPQVLAYRLGETTNLFKTLVALDILRELGLVSFGAGDGEGISVLPVEEKRELASSHTYQTLQKRW